MIIVFFKNQQSKKIPESYKLIFKAFKMPRKDGFILEWKMHSDTFSRIHRFNFWPYFHRKQQDNNSTDN